MVLRPLSFADDFYRDCFQRSPSVTSQWRFGYMATVCSHVSHVLSCFLMFFDWCATCTYARNTGEWPGKQVTGSKGYSEHAPRWESNTSQSPIDQGKWWVGRVQECFRKGSALAICQLCMALFIFMLRTVCPPHHRTMQKENPPAPSCDCGGKICSDWSSAFGWWSW